MKLGLVRKPAKVVPLVDVDEKSAGKGQQNYVTIISNLEGSTVEEVVSGRDRASLESYFKGLTEEQLAGIEAVSMDMSKSYIAAARNTFDDGESKIVFDRYHIMQHINKAVDTVRKQEHRALGRESLLTGTKYLLAKETVNDHPYGASS